MQRRETIPVQAWLAFGVLAVFASAVMLWLGRDLSFFFDECDFIHRRDITSVSDLLRPHNEHWTTVPMVLWLSLQGIVGLENYLPYRSLLTAIHVALAATIFYGLRGSSLGLAAAALLLFLGSSAENLVWAFQMVFLISTAAGIGALLAVDRGRYGIATGLLLVAVASSGVGLPFVAAAWVVALIRRDRRGWPLVLPFLVFVVWFITLGRQNMGDIDIVRVPRIVGEYTLAGASGLSGLPAPAAAVLIAMALAVAVAKLREGWRPTPLLVAALVGIFAQFALTALVREVEYQARYQTTFAALSLLAVGQVGWPRNRLLPAIGIILFVIALSTNMVAAIRAPHQLLLFATTFGYACDPFVDRAIP